MIIAIIIGVVGFVIGFVAGYVLPTTFYFEASPNFTDYWYDKYVTLVDMYEKKYKECLLLQYEAKDLKSIIKKTEMKSDAPEHS